MLTQAEQYGNEDDLESSDNAKEAHRAYGIANTKDSVNTRQCIY